MFNHSEKDFLLKYKWNFLYFSLRPFLLILPLSIILFSDTYQVFTCGGKPSLSACHCMPDVPIPWSFLRHFTVLAPICPNLLFTKKPRSGLCTPNAWAEKDHFPQSAENTFPVVDHKLFGFWVQRQISGSRTTYCLLVRIPMLFFRKAAFQQLFLTMAGFVFPFSWTPWGF